MVKNVRRGDTVVTSGGLVGKVTKVVDDDQIEVEIADGVRVRQMRSMVSRRARQGRAGEGRGSSARPELASFWPGLLDATTQRRAKPGRQDPCSTFPRWKAAAILLTALVVCLFAVPNFFPESVVQRWPKWAQRHIVLGLDLQGGSHILLEVDTAAVRKEKARAAARRRAPRAARRRASAAPGRGDPRQHRRGARPRKPTCSRRSTKLRELSQPLGGTARQHRTALGRDRRRGRRPDPAHAYRAGDASSASARRSTSRSRSSSAASTNSAPSSRRSSARASTASWCRCRACRIRRG